MRLTQRERIILQLETKGLSDYKIAPKINTDPPSITRSQQNAHKKLKQAKNDLHCAQQIGITINKIT